MKIKNPSKKLNLTIAIPKNTLSINIIIRLIIIIPKINADAISNAMTISVYLK